MRTVFRLVTIASAAIALLALIRAHGIFTVRDMDKFFAAEVKATGPSAAR